MKPPFIFVFCLAVAFPSASAQTANGTVGLGTAMIRETLLRSLRMDYDRQINPDNPMLQFGMTLFSLNLDERKSQLESIVWLGLYWRDTRLAWDTTVYPVRTLTVDSRSIWLPDVRMYRGTEVFSIFRTCDDVRVMIYPTGDVVWIPPCKLYSLCTNTLKTNPNDPQTCPLKFGPWAYDSDVLDINFFMGMTTPDTSLFEDASDWSLLSTSGAKNTISYSCCPDSYADVTYNVTIQRKPTIMSRQFKN